MSPRTAPPLALAVALLFVGCGAPSASPKPSPVLGRDWAKATVESPAGNDASIPPNRGPHPQHFQGGQADLLDVTTGGPGLVAVGYLDPSIVADAWTSKDGLNWLRVTDFAAKEGSLASAVAADRSLIVAVGQDGPAAAAWASADGLRWQQAPAQASLTEGGGQIRMTSIVAAASGFVAGGYVGSLSGPIRAAFWTSADGLTWTRIPEEPSFVDTRVAALAVATDGGADAGRVVAVGARGDAQYATAGSAWFSDDGSSWTPAELGSPEHGMLHGVTAGPGGAFVAVGADLDTRRAISWTSADGSAWAESAGGAEMTNHDLKIEMRDVAWDGGEYVAGGHLIFGTQFGIAVFWHSQDGATWVRVPDKAAFGQGKVYGMTAGGPGAVAVGSFGAPDFYVPTVWVTPGISPTP
jgi:hypothetical protein